MFVRGFRVWENLNIKNDYGHEEITDGDILLGNKIINDLPPQKRNLMMFQKLRFITTFKLFR